MTEEVKRLIEKAEHAVEVAEELIKKGKVFLSVIKGFLDIR